VLPGQAAIVFRCGEDRRCSPPVAARFFVTTRAVSATTVRTGFSRLGGEFRVLAGQLALIAAALFAGVAVYINVAEQPARLGLGDGALLTEWKSAYKRGFAMQAPLALVGSLFGLLAWWDTKDWRWLVGAVVLVTNWPYTLVAIMPINNQLKAINSAGAGSKSRMLIERWGRLHAVRSVLGFAATLIFLWASMR
jgi:hypothetical protein